MQVPQLPLSTLPHSFSKKSDYHTPPSMDSSDRGSPIMTPARHHWRSPRSIALYPRTPISTSSGERPTSLPTPGSAQRWDSLFAQELIVFAYRLAQATSEGGEAMPLLKRVEKALQTVRGNALIPLAQSCLLPIFYRLFSCCSSETLKVLSSLIASDSTIAREDKGYLQKVMAGLSLSRTLKECPSDEVGKILKAGEGAPANMVQIGDETSFSPEALTQILQNCQSVRCLVIHGQTLTPDVVEQIATFPHLRELVIRGGGITSLAPLEKLSSLEALTLDNVSGDALTAKGLLALSGLKITSLNLSHIPLLCASWLKALPATLTSLTLMYPREMTRKPLKGLAHLQLAALRIVGGDLPRMGWRDIQKHKLRVLRLDNNPKMELRTHGSLLKRLLKNCHALRVLDLGDSLSLDSTFSESARPFWDSLLQQGSCLTLRHLRIGLHSPLCFNKGNRDQSSDPSLIAQLFPGLRSLHVVGQECSRETAAFLSEHIPGLENVSSGGEEEFSLAMQPLHLSLTSQDN